MRDDVAPGPPTQASAPVSRRGWNQAIRVIETAPGRLGRSNAAGSWLESLGTN
jgi:hypothetical protein